MASDLAILRRVLGLFAPYRGWMLLGALLSTLTVLASVGLMAIAGYFISAMAIAGLAGVLMNYFLPAAGIRFFAIVRTGGRYAERVVTHEATFRLLAELRVWLFDKLVPLAPARLAHERGADLVARVHGDVETLQHAYLRLYAPALTAIVCVTVVVALFALRSVSAAWVLLALLVLAGLVVPLAVRKASAAPGAAIVQSSAELRVAVVDSLQGMSDLAVYGASERKGLEIRHLGDGLAGAQQRADTLGLAAEGTVTLCAGLALWITALIAIAAVQDGGLGRAEIPMLALAALAAFEAVAPLPLAMQRAGEVVAAARRIFALAGLPPVIAETPATSPVPCDTSIAMRDVRLRYEGAPHDALDGFDLEVASGQRIAIVGNSGAGKSSIARVLLRFWDYAGEVRLGGHDLRAYRPEDARAQLGVLTQYTHLLHGTIRDNLLLAAPAASEAALLDALDVTQLRAFVATQPQGLDTPVGEGGVRLSMGQARRLAIARVMLRNAPIVVLDEPAEGLDAHTARAVVDAVMRRLAGRTVIVITHDLAAIADHVDAVVTMRDGRATRRSRLDTIPPERRHSNAP